MGFRRCKPATLFELSHINTILKWKNPSSRSSLLFSFQLFLLLSVLKFWKAIKLLKSWSNILFFFLSFSFSFPFTIADLCFSIFFHRSVRVLQWQQRYSLDMFSIQDLCEIRGMKVLLHSLPDLLILIWIPTVVTYCLFERLFISCNVSCLTTVNVNFE